LERIGVKNARAKADRETFHWLVPDAGFEWVSGNETDIAFRPAEPIGEQRFLVPKSDSLGARLYSPLREHTGLFRAFAELQPTESAVQEFANKYGFLTGNRKFIRSGTAPRKGSSLTGISRTMGGITTFLERGDGLDDWRNQTHQLARVVRCLDALKSPRQEELFKLVRWAHDGKAVFVELEKHHRVLIAGEHVNAERFRRISPHDLVAPLWFFVQQEINDHIAAHGVSPRLLWNQQSKLEIRMVPDSLLGALWLQIATAIDANATFNTCKACRKWFAAGEEVRAGAKYCSNACRQKNKRAREGRARDLHKNGVSLREIAKQLETTTAVARGWIQK
jgi:hypothetical protein